MTIVEYNTRVILYHMVLIALTLWFAFGKRGKSKGKQRKGWRIFWAIACVFLVVNLFLDVSYSEHETAVTVTDVVCLDSRAMKTYTVYAVDADGTTLDFHAVWAVSKTLANIQKGDTVQIKYGGLFQNIHDIEIVNQTDT